MSRHDWRCRNPGCSIAHGAVLGRVTAEGGLVLDPGVGRFAVYIDTRRATIWCPTCGSVREFRGTAVMTSGD